MILKSKTFHFKEPKSTPKQIPLFEEQEDGNLLPYEREK